MNLFGAFCILHFIDRRPAPLRPCPPTPLSFFWMPIHPTSIHSFSRFFSSFSCALRAFFHSPFHHFCHLSIDPGIDNYTREVWYPFIAIYGTFTWGPFLSFETMKPFLNQSINHQRVLRLPSSFLPSFLPASLVIAARRSPLARTNERTNQRTEAFIRYSILRRCVAASLLAAHANANANAMRTALSASP